MHTPLSPDALSRRAVLLTGVAAGAAAMIPAVPAWARSSPLREPTDIATRKLKIGLIGCGGRGTGAILQAAHADANSVIWAMADLFPEKIESCHNNVRDALAESTGSDAATRLDVPPERRFSGVDGFHALIESGVDVVCICAYPAFRPMHLEAAVNKGVHVFCEKPMAVDTPGLLRVREAAAKAKEKSLSLVCGFCWRYNLGMQDFFKQLHSGSAGDVVSVYSNYLTGTLAKRPRKPEWSDMEFQFRNWWHFTWLSGDHLVEQACHSIDRMSWAFGDVLPTRCTGLGGRAAREGPEHGNVFDHFSIVYEYADGRRAHHACRQIDSCPGDNTDYITCTKGRGICDGFSSKFELFAPDATSLYKGVKDDAATSAMYQHEHNILFKSIRESAARNDGEWMCRSTMLALMARMACYTGQTISWEQAWNSKENLMPTDLSFGPRAMPSVAIPGKTKFV